MRIIGHNQGGPLTLWPAAKRDEIAAEILSQERDYVLSYPLFARGLVRGLSHTAENSSEQRQECNKQKSDLGLAAALSFRFKITLTATKILTRFVKATSSFICRCVRALACAEVISGVHMTATSWTIRERPVTGYLSHLPNQCDQPVWTKSGPITQKFAKSSPIN